MAGFSQAHAGELPLPRRGGQASDPVVEAVAVFSRRVAEKLGRGGAEEDQLRGPTEELFRDLGHSMGLHVVPYGEVRMPEFGVRPDYAIDIGRDRVGFIELKAPNTGVPPNWTKDHKRNREQYERLRDVPNLLYSDGVHWRLLQADGRPSDVVTFDGNVAEGTLRPPHGGTFHELISRFLGWIPKPPLSLSKLIVTVAGPCRMLRGAVAELLSLEANAPGVGPLTQLAEDWRSLLFPSLADRDFPDAYAQTVTFALLLAREGGIDFEGKNLRDIAKQLGKQHPLMGRALHVLAHRDAVRQLKILDMLRIVIGAVDWQVLPQRDREKYWDLYEPFLSEYDKALRRRSGTYYTPEPVAGFMIDFVDQILRARLRCRHGFADDDVIAMDPAMGTGTFLVEVIRSVARTVTEEHDEQFTRDVLRDLYRRRLIGFERSAAPYVVAELRLHQTLKEVYKVEPPERSMRFLANTLDDPEQSGKHGLEYAEITESRDRANDVKRKTPIVAMIGNPPYVARAHRRDTAPWVEKPRPKEHSTSRSDQPSLDDFRLPGNGKMEYALGNTGTYFWRWCTWKVFDADPNHRAGVVALITTSAYLKGAAFAGMRRYLRETCDEGWIIDLSPDGQRSDVFTRVFRDVKEPVCIGIFVRTRNGSGQASPASVHYRALYGRREEKFASLTAGLALEGDGWLKCPTGWTDDFLPEDQSWASNLRIDDIVQWGESGVKPGLTWVYAPRPEVLE
jgi:hypothetical protein